MSKTSDSKNQNSRPRKPFNVQSQWLPPLGDPAMAKFYQEINSRINGEDSELDKSVKELGTLIRSDETLAFLAKRACTQNDNIADSGMKRPEVNVPEIRDLDKLLRLFNALLKQPPKFYNGQLVGLPFSAVTAGIDPTPSGAALFSLPKLNEKMKGILNKWHEYLDTSASNSGFSKEGEQWLSATAKERYQFELWKKDKDEPPYWNSWNSFFTREFKDKEASRPIAAPGDDAVVCSPNEGTLFQWDVGLARKDVYWFKDMPYSLEDIFTTPDENDQATIGRHELVDRFTDGCIFQSYMSPYNSHRFSCPVDGKVLFDPIIIPGHYFHKLVLPDFSGHASLPYLVQVNTRGIIVIETKDYGYVCCMPVGMSEVSTINFDGKMKKGAIVKKGQEMGTFMYGGSYYPIIFVRVPGKKLFFQSSTGTTYDKRPKLPQEGADTNGDIINIGAQIGKWQAVDTTVDATQSWQNAGYVFPDKQYRISYVGGLWTANQDTNDGKRYGPAGLQKAEEDSEDKREVPDKCEGALIAQVGNYTPFLVGKEPKITPEGQSGQLKLCINDELSDDGLKNNLGAVTVSIKPFIKSPR